MEQEKKTQGANEQIDGRSRLIDGILLFVFSLLIRLIWLVYKSSLQNDSAVYITIAKNLVYFGTFSLGSDGTPSTADRPPLFPFLIAGLWYGPEAPVQAVLLVNVLLGAMSTVLVYLIAADRFERKVAILAAVFFAAGPMTCLFTVTILTEALFTFFIVLAVFLWGRNKFGLAGAAFGFAALARPSVIPFLIALPLLALIPKFRSQLRGYALMLIVALFICSVWVIRNAVVFDRFILVSASGWGLNLLAGTLETDTGGRVWDGEKWAPLDLKTNPVTRVDDEITDETEVDRIRMKRALARIAENPGQWVIDRARQYPKLFIDNGDYLLGSDNRQLRTAFAEGRWNVVVVKLIFIGGNLLVLAFALVGTWTLRSRLDRFGHIVFFPVYGVLVHLPMWIEPRYFLPMMPMVFILAAVGINSIVGTLRPAQTKELII